MGNDLKKIKGLTTNRELADRVGAAMFMYARNFDMTGEDSPEKLLAQWSIGNPMVADQTMLALVATDPAVIESTEVVESVIPNVNKNINVPIVNQYVPSNVSIDNVSDDVISASVEQNWSRVAAKFVVPTVSIPEPVTVGNGDPGVNHFLDPMPSTTERATLSRPNQ